MTSPARALKVWLSVTGIAYAVVGLDFVIRPRSATAPLHLAGGEPLEPEPPGVYNSLASAYMATIAALALAAASDPERRRDLIPLLLVAKGASATAFLVRYLQTRKRAFAAGAAMDALLLGITGGLLQALDEV